MLFNNKYSGISIILSLLTITLLMGSVSAACPAPTATDPNGIYYQCIMITTSNTLPPNAIVPIVLNGLSYNSLIANSLGTNIASITSSNGFKLPSWIEGIQGSPVQANSFFGAGGGNVLIWVNTENAIASTMPIYINFGTNTINYLNSNWLGMSPALWCAGTTCPENSYGQYAGANVDNGNVVFNMGGLGLYQNFMGTSVPSGWTLKGSSYTISNGITGVGGLGAGGIATIVTFPAGSNQIEQHLGMQAGSGTGNDDDWEGYTSNTYTGSLGWIMNSFGGLPKDRFAGTSGTIQPPNGVFHIWSAYYANTIAGLFSYDYGTQETISSTAQPSTISIGVSQDGAGTLSQENFYYFRLNTYPSGGVQPTTSNGVITKITISSLSISPNPVTYGTNSIVTASCSPASDNCAVDSPLGTHLCTGTGSCAFTANYIAYGAGTYSFNANDITAGTNSVASILTINAGAQIITLPSFPANYIYDGSTKTVTANVVCLFNQCTASHFINNVLITTFTAGNVYTTNGLAGTWTFVANSPATSNYLSNTVTNTLLVGLSNSIITCSQNGVSITASLNINSLAANELATCTLSSFSNQLSNLNFYFNNVVRSTGVTTSNNIVWNNQLNNEVANTLGNGNYVSNSLSWTTNDLGYIQTNSIFNTTAFETTTQGYKWQYNITKAAATANVVFTINNVYQSSNIINVATGAGTAQWGNFIYTVARLSSNNIVFGANSYLILNMIDGNVITYNPANQLLQTEYEAIPSILGATNSFAGISNTLTANVAVPAPLNRLENIYRNGVLYTSGATSVAFSIASWAAGTYTVNALDTVALRNASTTFTIQATVLGQCGIVPAPYYTSGNVAALGGAISNVLIMNVTSETTFAHVGNLINASGHIVATGVTYNGVPIGFTNTINWLSGTFCINLVSGAAQSVNITGEFNYQSNAIPRNYQYNNTQITQGVLKTINALTINSLTGINVGQFNIFVINPTLTQIATYVQIFKYYPNTNNYQLVDFIKTGTVGQTQAYLENSKFYTFNIYDANLHLLGVISSINGNPLYCITTGGCSTQLQIPTNQSTSFTNYGYIQQSCTYTNLTKILSCAVTDPTSTTSSYRLNVSMVGILSTTGVCNTVLTGASGVLTCTLPNNSSTYIYKLFANTGANNYQINTGQISFGGASVFGALGYLIFFIIILVVTLIGSDHPILLLVLDTVAIILTYVIGFIGLSIGLLVNAIVILLILAYKLKR